MAGGLPLKPRKPDWAKVKVDAIFKHNGGLLSGDDLVRLLRAEQRRACQRLLVCQAANLADSLTDAWDRGYDKAIDDCVKAIGGKP